MSEFSNGRSKPWNIYSRPSPSPSQTDANREGPQKNFGTSMSAISFGFVATAILVSMFLIMAIFEHLFKPNATHAESRGIESREMQKLGRSETVSLSIRTISFLTYSGLIRYILCKIHSIKRFAQTSYALDFSVLMPGQQYPTYIAQAAPLPSRREGVHWPSHEHGFA
ncbi:uncharacterized protein [Primulina huaijiensis]|uniref:uncharacterized protein n=1 Tax=Primulina huaijiensis TaxID=1492673 RepID=UPI003CC74637